MEDRVIPAINDVKFWCLQGNKKLQKGTVPPQKKIFKSLSYLPTRNLQEQLSWSSQTIHSLKISIDVFVPLLL